MAFVAATLSVAACGPAEPGGSSTGAAGSGGATSTGGSGQASGTGGSSGPGAGGASAGDSGGSSPAGAGGAVGAGGALGGGGSPTGGRGGAGGAGARGGRGGDGSGGATGGSVGTGGATGGNVGTAGAVGTGGTSTGGRGGSAAGGRAGAGGSGTAGATGAGGRGGAGGSGSGTCTASKAVNTNATGSGPHKVVVETNADSGINEGTIFRPMDLGGTEKYPIFVWGEGGCSQNGLSNATAMAEIASHGYFVIADGTPNSTAGNRSMNTSDIAGMGKPLLAYVTWAIAENGKACSAYYQSLDTTKVASNGFSCGGLMAEGTAGDPRITTWGLNSSGLFSANQAFYKTVHTPVLIVLGGPSDIAYENGERDYDNISALGIPIMLFSKDLGHGGDLFAARGGDFTKIDLAWLNWQLKADETATGKGLLVGAGCSYCTNSAWEVKSKNIP
jgi:hypothetical protein